MGDWVRIDAVVVEKVLELQRVLVHPGNCRASQGRVWSGYWLGVRTAVVCWLVKKAMSSLSPSGTVVSVPVSESSSSPPVAGGSVYETSQLADVSGGSARVTAALRRRRAI